MAFSNTSSPNGLVTKSTAPAFIASTVVGTSPYPVMKMIGTSARSMMRFWRSSPFRLGAELVRPLTAAPDPDGWALVERLLEDLSRLPERIWLVIDDLHELESNETLTQLTQLALRAPAQLRLVLATRKDLWLGLHRLRLEGELTEIRGSTMSWPTC